MRRSGHPSRPRAITCCFFASFKTLLISTKATCLTPKSTSRASFSLAGFQVTLIGRFWVTPEDWPAPTSLLFNQEVAPLTFIAEFRTPSARIKESSTWRDSSTYPTLLRRTLERWDKAYVTSVTVRTEDQYRAPSSYQRPLDAFLKCNVHSGSGFKD